MLVFSFIFRLSSAGLGLLEAKPAIHISMGRLVLEMRKID